MPIYNVPLLPILQHGSNSAKVVVGFSFGSLRLTIYLQRSGARGPMLKGPKFKVLSDFQLQNKEGRPCKHAVSSEKALGQCLDCEYCSEAPNRDANHPLVGGIS